MPVLIRHLILMLCTLSHTVLRRAGVVMGLVLYAGAVLAQSSAVAQQSTLPFSMAQAQTALDELTARIAGPAQSGRIRISEILMCYPAFRMPENVRVCALRLRNAAGREQIGLTGFQKSAQGWLALPEALSPACASTQVVQATLQSALKRNNLRVLQSLLEGRGEFTNVRGQKRDKTGAWRLRCSYSVELQPGTEIILATYMGFNGQQFTLENDFERWD